jgi:hypothetical protein
VSIYTGLVVAIAVIAIVNKDLDDFGGEDEDKSDNDRR